MSQLGISHPIYIDVLKAALDPVSVITDATRALLDTLIDGGGDVTSLRIHAVRDSREQLMIYAQMDV